MSFAHNILFSNIQIFSDSPYAHIVQEKLIPVIDHMRKHHPLTLSAIFSQEFINKFFDGSDLYFGDIQATNCMFGELGLYK